MGGLNNMSEKGLTGQKVPRHVAIIMDGNGRWATRRCLPRFAGHRAGADAVREVVRCCGEKGVEVLTLFAFSSENWRRPQEEVGLLMGLFMSTLESQVRRLHENNVRLRVIGERRPFSEKLQRLIREAECKLQNNTGLSLVIAANYGGHWDVAEAARRIACEVAAGELSPHEVDSRLVGRYLCLGDLPEPDLFIRTGGEKRISNFLLWQLAYTELYFTDTLWPDFDRSALDGAFASFRSRQRRFGQTGEQVATAGGV